MGAAVPLLWWVVLPTALVSPGWLRVLRRQPASVADWTVAIVVAISSGLGLIYLSTGMAAGVKPFVFGRRGLLLFGGLLLVGAMLARWGRNRLLQGFAFVAVIALTLLGLKGRADHKVGATAGDYLRAQVWARDHTPRNALFMPPPTLYYGWRDYSQRSSFGNLREWLHTSWLYDSNFERYQEGMRRFNEFNIAIGPYLHAKPPIAAMKRLSAAVRERYYDASDEWRLGLAQRYGIDYFVFWRKDIVQPSRLPIVYENEHFVIRTASE